MIEETKTFQCSGNKNI